MDIYQFAFGVVRNLVDVGFVSCTDLSALVGPHPGRYCQTLRVERMTGGEGSGFPFEVELMMKEYERWLRRQ